MLLTSHTWRSIPTGGTVLVPVGSIEQHGPHLPLDTDTVIATTVCHQLAELVGATAAPAVAYGASGEHQAFAGTTSIGTQALATTLIELGRSLHEWAARVCFINGHGGNVPALQLAVSTLMAEGRHTHWVSCSVTGADAHAGHTETSLMLHLAPHRVRMSNAEPGNTGRLQDLLPSMKTAGVAAVSPNGVLGNPLTATAEAGQQILTDMVHTAAKQLTCEVSGG
ncbi:mycofactocin biosynthesis peptidyl-dipeptidase MftE [Janibacter melonis]|uniref:mycofactocin biosynthesis peptidyl-dipeptidase MftE n=1 Tax=Janibacter melonis TaxID=262209 RepID=UPI001748BC84|nr:mycofactocin biosynthesis peptidyl-dipeptidase MftE [Janibacter melonis]